MLDRLLKKKKKNVSRIIFLKIYSLSVFGTIQMLPLHLVRQDVESLSHVTARHDFNWARAAPQVATWVSLARAERWRQSGTAEGNVSRFSESREGFFSAS